MQRNIVYCITFDPPGRGDGLIQDLSETPGIEKIVNYCAKGSNVSAVGTQMGDTKYLKIEENTAGTGNYILHNHGIFEIARALGALGERIWEATDRETLRKGI